MQINNFFNLAQTKSFTGFSVNIPSICFNWSFLLEEFANFKAPTCFSVCFSKAFPKEEHENLACSILCLRLEGNISSPVRYSLLWIFPDDNADIFAASLLISYYSFSSLILSWIIIISFYIFSTRFFLKLEGLSDARVASITKKEYSFAEHFL